MNLIAGNAGKIAVTQTETTMTTTTTTSKKLTSTTVKTTKSATKRSTRKMIAGKEKTRATTGSTSRLTQMTTICKSTITLDNRMESQEFYCFEKNIMYKAKGVKIVRNINNQFVCQSHCQRNPQCESFTWSAMTGKYCWLKGSITSKEPSPQSISGLKVCPTTTTTSTTTASTCFEYNILYTAKTFKRIKSVADEFACQMHCQRYTECKFFTWNQKQWELCLLKNLNHTKSNVKKQSRHYVSGPKVCPGVLVPGTKSKTSILFCRK